MAENEDDQVSTESDGKPTLWVSFCPDLGLYHVHREVDDEDPSDNKFTRDELLDLVDGMLKSGQVVEAPQLATLCAWARLFAHKEVIFYTSGSFRVFNPVAPPPEEAEESEDMRQFFAKWKEEHPTTDSIPTVVGYGKKRS